MKKVALTRIEGESDRTVVSGEILGFQTDQSGTTFLCGGCGEPIVEGFIPGLVVFSDIAVVCQHCEAHNQFDSTTL